MSYSSRILSKTLSVSPQISVSDIDSIATAGIKTVICNRPDEELSSELTSTEPDHETVEKLLAQYHIKLIYQPIYHVTKLDIVRFADLLHCTPSPILAYCTSGTRSTLLWALGQVQIEHQPKEAIIHSARLAGYAIEPYLID
ncbi:MAG: TIGR01244 family sulfur transferase [Ostreibacterium sp.]